MSVALVDHTSRWTSGSWNRGALDGGVDKTSVPRRHDSGFILTTMQVQGPGRYG